MKQLDPKAVWLFYINSMSGLLVMAVVSVWISSTFFLSLSTYQSMPGKEDESIVIGLATLFMGIWWIFLALFAIAGYVISKLSYKYYKYEVRDDGFRKEHGIIWKKYVTIPYERIQNVDIYRGLIARLLKLSDLHIQTAGMSTSVGALSEGRLPGLSPEVAEELRDELIKRARGKNQGL